jgi:hypothetical protein
MADRNSVMRIVFWRHQRGHGGLMLSFILYCGDLLSEAKQVATPADLFNRVVSVTFRYLSGGYQ